MHEHGGAELNEDDEKKADLMEKRAARMITRLALYLAPVAFMYYLLLQWIVSETPGGARRWISIPAVQLISKEILRNHFAAVVGLPLGAVMSLWIVTILRSQAGPIEFDAFGFRFRGAAGPVILWILCFLAIAWAIKLLW